MSVKKALSWLQSDALLFVLILSPFLYIAGVVLWHGIPDITNSGDGALLEMSTRSLFSRGILLGPYSRFLFFHPGPLYFLIRYPFYMLMGQRNTSFLIVTTLISMASLFGGWYIVKKLTNKSTSLIFSAVFALFLLKTDKVLWLSEWNPHIIMFPLILFTVVMAAVSSRKFKYLYLGVLAGSFVAQTHIGGIPVLAFSLVAVLLCAVLPRIITSNSKRTGPGYLKHLLISFALLLLLWAPPIYEEVTAETQGNMSKIREFFQESEPDQDVTTALEPWSEMLTSFELEGFYGHLRRNELVGVYSNIIVALRLLFLAMGFSLLRRKGRYGFLCSLNLICIIMHGATYYSVSQIRGELNPYLIEWMKIVAPLSLFTILSSSFALIGRGNKISVVKKYFRWILILFIMYASITLSIEVRGYFRTDLHQSFYAEIAVQELSVPLKEIMNQQPETYFIMKLESQECWLVMFGLMNELEKQEYHICCEDNVWFTSTQPPSEAATRILHIGTLTDRGENNPTLIAQYNDIGIILQ